MSYNSVWMSRWTQRSCYSSPQNHNLSSTSFGNEQNCYAANDFLSSREKPIEFNGGWPAKGPGEIETQNFNFRNDNLGMTSTTLGTKSLGFQSSPIDGLLKNASTVLKDSKGSSDMKALGQEITSKLDSNVPSPSSDSGYVLPLLAVASNLDKTPSGECYSGQNEMLQANEELAETSQLFRDSSLVIARPLLEGHHPTSSTHMVLCGTGNGSNDRIPVLPMPRGKPLPTSEEQLSPIDAIDLECEKFDYQRQSTLLVREEKVERHSRTARPLTSYSWQNKASLFQMDPSATNNLLPIFGGEQCLKKQNLSGISHFQNRSNLQEATNSERLYHGSNTLQKFSNSLQDVETMRICTTTVDSVVPLYGFLPRFSQTTQSLLITRKTDLNSSKEKQILTSPGDCTGLIGDTSVNFQTLSPFSSHRQQRVNIQFVGDSTATEGTENVGDVNTSDRFFDAEDVKALGNPVERRGKRFLADDDWKNESSAETDTMDLDDLKENNQLSGVHFSPLNKDKEMGSITPQLIIDSTGEIGCGQLSIKVPDINLGLPALESGDNMDPSSSRTQSLDMEIFLARAEWLSQSESNLYAGGSAKPGPSNRWIKRLRLSDPEFLNLGTKSSNMGKESCQEKSKSSCGKNCRGSVANSEQQRRDGGSSTMDTAKKGKDAMIVLDDSADSRSYGVGESSSMDAAKEAKDTLTLLPWIRRWCHDQSATLQKMPDAMVVCEQESSELACEDLQNKQFPSIAAMALMGKAMNGFRTCEFQRRGSFVVWNTP